MKSKPFKGFPLWAAAFWLLVWEALARLVDQSLLLVSPLTAAHRLLQLMGEASFWQSVAYSLTHILMGFLLGALLGVSFAILSYRFRWMEQLLMPLTATVKAIPVASFVILALLWVTKHNLSTLISLLLGFPVIYSNALTGLKSTDSQLIEMSRLFRVPFGKQLRALYLPSLAPYLHSGLSIAIGLCWKSGIAAEVIGTPRGSIGERLYNSKIYLETADLFAWTMTVVLLSVVCEKLLKLFLSCLEKWLKKPAVPKEASKEAQPALLRAEASKALPSETLNLTDLHAAFEGKEVIGGLSFSVETGRRYVISGPSGSGKTTLLRVLMGLLKPRSGDASDFTKKQPSVVFQEDRLLSWMNAAQNLRYVADIAPGEANALLMRLGIEEESLSQPVSEYSGGMKRRVAIARALIAGYEILYLDEPYKGLDEQTRKQVQAVVEELSAGRTLFLVTHDLREAEGYLPLSLTPPAAPEIAG